MNETAIIKINGTGVHAAPIFLQLLLDAALDWQRVQMGGSAATMARPGVGKLKLLPLGKMERQNKIQAKRFEIMLGICQSFFFVSCFFMVFVVEEKVGEVKTHQYVNGVDIWLYWVANWTFDFLFFTVPILTTFAVLSLTGIILDIGHVDLLTQPHVIDATIFLFFMFGAIMPVYSYAVAGLFSSAESALSTTLTINVLGGTLLFIAGLILEFITIPSVQEPFKFFGWMVRFWPPYAFSEGLRRIFVVSWYLNNQPPETRTDDEIAECKLAYDRHETPASACSIDVWDEYGAAPAFRSLV